MIIGRGVGKRRLAVCMTFPLHRISSFLSQASTSPLPAKHARFDRCGMELGLCRSVFGKIRPHAAGGLTARLKPGRKSHALHLKRLSA